MRVPLGRYHRIDDETTPSLKDIPFSRGRCGIDFAPHPPAPRLTVHVTVTPRFVDSSSNAASIKLAR